MTPPAKILSADRLADLARRTPGPLLRAAARPPARRFVIAEIFRQMPRQMKPAANAADAIARWEITAGEPPDLIDTWYLRIEDGVCTTSRKLTGKPAPQPRVTFRLDALDLVRMASGAANPMQMFQSGRIKIAGDLFYAAQMQGMFRIPS
jgi:predicted lipid carrier protein YhbT